MIIIKNLHVIYDKVAVIEDLDLILAPGNIHGLIGLNGSGKTTLLNALYGFIKSSKGTVELNGKALYRRDIAYLETQNYFYPDLTAREYLNLFPVQNNSFDLDTWEGLLQLVLDEFIENYSTGMKKKLALLGLLKMDKPIILLDEPFNGVDMETAKIIKLLLKNLKAKNKTIIVTSHILETLTNMCDFIHHLENKKIKKTYEKVDLDKIDSEIFNLIEQRTVELINKAI